MPEAQKNVVNGADENRIEAFNRETVEALKEADDILSGRKKAKTYETVEPLFEDLNVSDPSQEEQRRAS